MSRGKPQNSSLASLDVNSSGQKFLSSKGEQYYRVRYEWEFSKFLTSARSELSKIHQDYPNDYLERDVSAQDKMWKNVMHLQNVLFGDGRWSEYRKGKLLLDLHDNFLQLTTSRYISKPAFEGCVLVACRGYKHSTAADEKLVIALTKVYNSFDVHSKDTFDWRKFLFYLHFLSDPTKNAKEQLLSAFSSICNKSFIDLQDLGVVVFPLVKADTTERVLRMMDGAWAEVKASQQQIDENVGSTKVTKRDFVKMLDIGNARSFLFDQSNSSWGRGRIFRVFISKWEEEFYNETLLHLVKVSRREASIKAKLSRDHAKTSLDVLRHWVGFAKYQRSLRSILNKINHRTAKVRKRRGLMAFVHLALCHRSALDIQRVGRGFFGRLVANHTWLVYASATMIQTHFRMYIAKRTLDELSSRYYWAIVEVQRNIRGALGRRLAYRKLITLVEQHHIRNMKEKERLEMERGVWCLTKLQAFWRRKKATIRSCEMRQKRQREINVQRAMETERKLFLRERQIYERQLEDFYESMREEYTHDAQTKSRIARDSIKVRTLQRKLKNDAILNAPPDNSEQLATEQWKKDWEAKIASGVDEIKSRTIQCLDQPDNKVEKRTRATTKKRIKKRVPEVLKRAKERGIPMETKEATLVAREEILHIIGEEERTRLRGEMDKAILEREGRKEVARLERETKEKEAHARASIYAVSILAMACRKWLARKELRRLCLETHEKIFDNENHAFYYRNKITGVVSWAKPKAMGVFDIPAKDEWKLLRDVHNFPYYFNPCTMEMKWHPPADQVMCCGVVPHTWWREYPVRLGQCPNFGDAALNEGDGKWYCEECSQGK